MRPRLALWAWLALLLGGAWFSLTRVSVVNDMAAFLPREEGLEQTVVLDALREGPAARLIIVALSGATDTAHLAAASRALAARLRGDTHFLRVVNGPAVPPPEEQDRWFAYRYLLAPLPDDAFTTAGLQRELETRLLELSAPFPLLDKAHLPADPQAAFRRLLSRWEEGGAPHLRHGVWFDPTGQQALLLLETRAAGFDLDGQAEARAAIIAAVAPDITVEFSGPGIIAAATRDIIRNEVQWLSALATVVLLLILLIAYRSPRLLLLSALPLLAAIVAAVTVTALAFGSLHGITLAFGITLLGVAIDYPLHLFSHVQAGVPPYHNLRRIWPTLRLGVASTAVGYLAMAASPFNGLAQLALFMVGGLLAAVATVRWVLPPLLPAAPAVRANFLAVRGAGYSLWWLPLLALPALGYLLLTPWPVVETELSALSPVPPAWRELDERLRRAAGAPDVSRLLLVDGGNAEEVLQRSEALEAPLKALRSDGVIAGYRLPSDYLPAAETQIRRRDGLPDADALANILEAALQGLSFRSGLFEPFLQDVAASRRLTPLLLEDIDDTVLGNRLAALLRPHGERWLGLVPLYAVHDERALVAWTERSLVPVRYLNLRQAADQMVADFMRGAGIYLLAGLSLILILLGIGLRSLVQLARVTLPVLGALVLTVAILHMSGAQLSLFHLVALLLVLGLGIDYGLFFARRATAEERARSGHAVTVCAISTAGVFGILALSQIPVLHAIGSTVALGVVLSYGFARLVRTT